MIRIYTYHDKMWRFEEGEQPEGAVLVEAEKPKAEPKAKAAPKRSSRKSASEKEAE